MVTVADEAWIATALLHREQPDREAFSKMEILDRARLEGIQAPLREGVGHHVSYHAVATKRPNPGRAVRLSETSRGMRRLVRTGDARHPERTGPASPDPSAIPTKYRYLLDWYHTVYDQSRNRERTIREQPPTISAASADSAAARLETDARAALSRAFGVPLAAGSVSGVPKRFDFVAHDGSLVGDTVSSHIAEHVWLLEKTDAPTKVIVFGDENAEASHWTRRYGHLAAGLRFYRHHRTGEIEELAVESPVESGWSRLSSTAFARDWDSAEDSVYDELPTG